MVRVAELPTVAELKVALAESVQEDATVSEVPETTHACPSTEEVRSSSKKALTQSIPHKQTG